MDRFYIIANSQKEETRKMRDTIVRYLEERGRRCLYQEADGTGEKEGYLYTNPALVPDDTEGVIVLGGDGTVIQAARDLARKDVAFLGINMGNLGYLTETDSARYREALDCLMEGRYHLERRMMLDGELVHADGQVFRSRALNDIVISRSGALRVINFNIYVNGRHLNSYHADGMIISTPTGSTGYNLSAGGPIVEPSADMLLITPICAHTLNTRSIVLSGEDTVEVLIGPGRKIAREQAAVTFDGDTFSEFVTGEGIVVKKSRRSTKLIRINDSSFLEILSKKLK